LITFVFRSTEAHGKVTTTAVPLVPIRQGKAQA